MSNHELAAKLRQIRDLQSLIEEAQQEKEALQDEIKAFMGEAEELRAGECKVTWKPVTSSRIDTAALKRELPEVVARYTRQSTTRRFCVC